MCWYRKKDCRWPLSATRQTAQKGRDILETIVPDCSKMCLSCEAEFVVSAQWRHRTKRGRFPALVKSDFSRKVNWTWKAVRHFFEWCVLRKLNAWGLVSYNILDITFNKKPQQGQRIHFRLLHNISVSAASQTYPSQQYLPHSNKTVYSSATTDTRQQPGFSPFDA